MGEGESPISGQCREHREGGSDTSPWWTAPALLDLLLAIQPVATNQHDDQQANADNDRYEEPHDLKPIGASDCPLSIVLRLK